MWYFISTLVKIDLLFNWRNRLILNFLILNLVSGNNCWQTAMVTCAFSWEMVKGCNKTSLWSHERFLHTETKLEMPVRLKKNWFCIVGTFCDFFWCKKPGFIFIRVFLSERWEGKSGKSLRVRRVDHSPFPDKLGNTLEHSQLKSYLARLKLAPRHCTNCPFLRKAWFTSPLDLLVALITSWASRFIGCIQRVIRNIWKSHSLPTAPWHWAKKKKNHSKVVYLVNTWISH